MLFISKMGETQAQHNGGKRFLGYRSKIQKKEEETAKLLRTETNELVSLQEP